MPLHVSTALRVAVSSSFSRGSGPNEETRCTRFMANAVREVPSDRRERLPDEVCPLTASLIGEGWRAYCARWRRNDTVTATFGECLNAQGFPCSERVLFGDPSEANVHTW